MDISSCHSKLHDRPANAAKGIYINLSALFLLVLVLCTYQKKLIKNNHCEKEKCLSIFDKTCSFSNLSSIFLVIIFLIWLPHSIKSEWLQCWGCILQDVSLNASISVRTFLVTEKLPQLNYKKTIKQLSLRAAFTVTFIGVNHNQWQ